MGFFGEWGQYKRFLEIHGGVELKKPFFENETYYLDQILEANKTLEFQFEKLVIDNYILKLVIFRDSMEVWYH